MSLVTPTYSSPVSTETAPLLRDPDADSEDGETTTSSPTFGERLNALAHEPLTPLTKLLLCVSLVLLILAAVSCRQSFWFIPQLNIFKVFIGLFAGVQHKLNSERGRNRDDGKPPSTVTSTATSTVLTTTTAHPPTPTNIPEQVSSRFIASFLSSF
jgi:endothelin-converting enzyme